MFLSFRYSLDSLSKLCRAVLKTWHGFSGKGGSQGGGESLSHIPSICASGPHDAQLHGTVDAGRSCGGNLSCLWERQLLYFPLCAHGSAIFIGVAMWMATAREHVKGSVFDHGLQQSIGRSYFAKHDGKHERPPSTERDFCSVPSIQLCCD